jgi:hypothetical protein
MNCIRVLASCVLVAAGLPAQTDGPPTIRLALDRTEHTMAVQVFAAGTVFLVIGERGMPVPIGNIELDVRPDTVATLGTFAVGEVRTFHVPRILRDAYAEAVLVDSELRMADSNVVALMDAYADLVDASFRAELIVSMPPGYALLANVTTPTNGYDFTVDATDFDGKMTNVYLRLVEPAAHEIPLPVLQNLSLTADLVGDVGSLVRVHLMRVTRGGIEPGVYRLMLELPVL